MRVCPIAARGVTEEAALHGIAQVGRRHGAQRASGELAGIRRSQSPQIEQKTDDGRHRKLRSSPESAELAVFVAEKLRDGLREVLGQVSHRRAAGLLDRGGERARITLHLSAAGDPRIRHRIEHLSE